MSKKSTIVNDTRDPCLQENNPRIFDIAKRIITLFKETENVSKFDVLNKYMDNFTGKASEQMLNEILQNSGITP